jgi:hypothetical protein
MGTEGDKEVKMTDADAKDLEKFREEFEAHKDDLKSGPIFPRHSTDICCCILFFIFLIGMGAVFVYGLMYGNPSNITIGWDGNSPTRGCGFSEETMDYPYLYFVSAPSTEEF